MPDARRTALAALWDVLGREEALLGDLLRHADAMRDALISSDYLALAAVTDEMTAGAERMEALEQERDELVASLGLDDASLHAVAALADTLGMKGFATVRQRLARAAAALHEAQERNAGLILGAARIRQRWFALLAGRSSPTYGSGGRHGQAHQAGFVSRSA
jgi:hypothetical protein